MAKPIKVQIVDASKEGKMRGCDEIIITPSKEVQPDETIPNSKALNNVIQGHLEFFQTAQYALLLSANDRIMTCEEYLLKKQPQELSEIDIITYFAVVAMLHDALKYAYNSLIPLPPNATKEQKNAFVQTDKQIFVKSIDEIKKFLKQVFDLTDDEANKFTIADDEVIEMLRSLIFAHSCQTDHAGFLGKYNNAKLQFYSPWAYVYQKSINLRIYYKEQMFDLKISIEEIKLYVEFLHGKILELKEKVESEAKKDPQKA